MSRISGFLHFLTPGFGALSHLVGHAGVGALGETIHRMLRSRTSSPAFSRRTTGS